MGTKNFDIIIVGGGHAGVEAAYIASQFKKLEIAIITLPGVGIASAPCNPSIGGVGKGQVVRELDALGGLMPSLADKAGIQFRTLNESKGYAVQSTRVQIDKDLYSKYAEEELDKIPNITIVREKVSSIKKEDNFIVETECSTWNSSKLIVTVGTFLNGKLHIGSEQKQGGRHECESSGDLVSLFSKVKTAPKRFKTGTPPRLAKSSIDFSVMEEQPSDNSVRNFSSLNTSYDRNLDQVSCYLARTNRQTMDVIKNNLDKSPMYNGQIKAVGARYCPSIEDKVSRYPEKADHHVFVEPEGLNLESMYPSGISSSLPREVQDEMISSISGLENAEIMVYGYAVEYDVVDTTELNYSLEYKAIPGLYFAGQVNGTSGYEEAGGQGYIAGVNAALQLENKPELILNRNKSYIGVMVEDLISNLRDEPYRLFTARSENRLYIREDNAIIRLFDERKALGLNNERDLFNVSFNSLFKSMMEVFKDYFLDQKHPFCQEYGISINRRISFSELLKQAKFDPVVVLKNFCEFNSISLSPALINCLAISNKYEGYIAKAEVHHRKMEKLDTMQIKWEELVQSENISFECKRRIERIKPISFGQLKLIEGIRPATLAAVAGKTI